MFPRPSPRSSPSSAGLQELTLLAPTLRFFPSHAHTSRPHGTGPVCPNKVPHKQGGLNNVYLSPFQRLETGDRGVGRALCSEASLLGLQVAVFSLIFPRGLPPPPPGGGGQIVSFPVRTSVRLDWSPPYWPNINLINSVKAHLQTQSHQRR